MRWRNGEHGYGVVTKTLHWAVVLAMAVQFAIGFALDDSGGRGRGRGRGSGSGRGRGRGGEDSEYDVFGDDALLTAHVLLGLTILGLAAIRLAWRMTTPLPPWAPTLSSRERTLAHWTERGLYLAMFAVPLTGLVLVLAGDDDALPWHVASHLAFYVLLGAHVGLVAKHQLGTRDRLLQRML